MRRPEDIVGLHHLIDELLSRIAHLEAGHERLSLENEQLREENVQLREENARLKRQVSQDSHNSHRPPFSEGYGKKPAFPKSNRHRRRGGVRGHKGQTLAQVETPDVVVPLRVEKCSCGQDLSIVAQSLLARRQCFDLPGPRLEVTEYQTFGCSCLGCGTYHTSRFPAAISAPVQYGSRVRALSCLLNVEYRLPFKKIKHLFEDLFGQGINESTQHQMLAQAYTGLEETEGEIKKRLMASRVAHFDETGLRVKGRLHWLHVSSTAQATHLFVHQKRGREALTSADSVLLTFPGWAVHDSYASYFTSWPCRHSLCGAHLLRELTDAYENGSRWAKHMHRFLLALYRMTGQGSTCLKASIKKLAISTCACSFMPKRRNPHLSKRTKRRDGQKVVVPITYSNASLSIKTPYWPLSFTMMSRSPIIKLNETCVRQKSNRKSPHASARLKGHNTMLASKPSSPP